MLNELTHIEGSYFDAYFIGNQTSDTSYSMCPARVKRLTAYAAYVDGNSVMACTGKQRTERRKWNVKSNAESRRKANEERKNREVLTEENEGTDNWTGENDEERISETKQEKRGKKREKTSFVRASWKR